MVPRSRHATTSVPLPGAHPLSIPSLFMSTAGLFVVVMLDEGRQAGRFRVRNDAAGLTFAQRLFRHRKGGCDKQILSRRAEHAVSAQVEKQPRGQASERERERERERKKKRLREVVVAGQGGIRRRRGFVPARQEQPPFTLAHSREATNHALSRCPTPVVSPLRDARKVH
ncbi:hypothetical protein BS50DRAFT_102942 [Corynespora cassiicola Philippines]|uniref:Uncharacterized protein n=1 Tax=Corynespora cassiicola Philippines TaxID=1448308 RepID=A0A2T2NC60_CORCC|nr:hypothetical protein BS50DRAFT_102942 [Corynespora cassiicola Philippines]